MSGGYETGSGCGWWLWFTVEVDGGVEWCWANVGCGWCSGGCGLALVWGRKVSLGSVQRVEGLARVSFVEWEDWWFYMVWGLAMALAGFRGDGGLWVAGESVSVLKEGGPVLRMIIHPVTPSARMLLIVMSHMINEMSQELFNVIFFFFLLKHNFPVYNASGMARKRYPRRVFYHARRIQVTGHADDS